MKTLTVLVLFIASLVGLVQWLDTRGDNDVRVEPVGARPSSSSRSLQEAAAPSTAHAPPDADALRKLDPAALDRAAVFRASLSNP